MSPCWRFRTRLGAVVANMTAASYRHLCKVLIWKDTPLSGDDHPPKQCSDCMTVHSSYRIPAMDVAPRRGQQISIRRRFMTGERRTVDWLTSLYSN